MWLRGFWYWCYYVARCIQWVFGLLGIVLPTCTKISLPDVEQNLPWAAPWLAHLQGNIWWTAPSSLLIAAFATFIMKQVGEPWIWQLVHNLLDDFRDHLFKDKEGPVHYHRVTLFKCNWFCLTKKPGRVLWRWPWRHWLTAVARSGHTTIKSKPAFAIPDDGEKFEGIAGYAWSAKGAIHKTNLPKLSSTSSDSNFQKYADNAQMNVADVKYKTNNGKHLACSYCAFPVETKGKIWGVIVIDSQDTELISFQEINGFFHPLGKCLSKLLERI